MIRTVKHDESSNEKSPRLFRVGERVSSLNGASPFVSGFAPYHTSNRTSNNPEDILSDSQQNKDRKFVHKRGANSFHISRRIFDTGSTNIHRYQKKLLNETVEEKSEVLGVNAAPVESHEKQVISTSRKSETGDARGVGSNRYLDREPNPASFWRKMNEIHFSASDFDVQEPVVVDENIHEKQMISSESDRSKQSDKIQLEPFVQDNNRIHEMLATPEPSEQVTKEQSTGPPTGLQVIPMQRIIARKSSLVSRGANSRRSIKGGTLLEGANGQPPSAEKKVHFAPNLIMFVYKKD